MSAKKAHRTAKSIVSTFASFEQLETRELRSASPTNFDGSFTAVQNGTAIEVDLSHSGSQYSGTVQKSGQSFSLTAKEKHNRLSGSVIDANGTSHKFAAALHGTRLNVVMAGQSTVLDKLVGRVGNDFTFSMPASWQAADSQQGVVITSPDKNLRAAVSAGVVNQTITPQDIIAAAQSQGSTILSDQPIKNVTVNGVNQQQESVLISYHDSNGNPFATGLLIETNSANGQTSVTLTSMTAPTSTFTGDASVLSKVLKSIKFKGTTNTSAHTRYYDYYGNWINDYSSYDFGGFYDPGVQGDWSYTGGFDYSTNPWLYYEQTAMADSSAAMDASVANFDAYIME